MFYSATMSKPARILIVEDDALIGVGIHRMVKSAGYTVTAMVASGESAIQHVDEYALDLVLMDVNLAGKIDGIEAATHIRATHNLPIIYLTGFSDEQTVERAKATDPVGYLLKPFREKELQTTIEIGLYKHKIETELQDTNWRLEQEIVERKQVEEELRKYREHLEDLVKERTAKLQQEIIEHKRTEVELQHAKEVAETANKLKSEFLANVSHDIRTPMNAILGFSDILKERLRDSPEYHGYLNGIMHGGRTLLQLINDILDLSRIEAGQLDIRPEAVNLQTLITEIQQMFALKASEKGIRFESHLSPDTPATVLLDGVHLRQILVNLVGNAIKFTEKGSVTLKVRSSCFSDINIAEALTTNQRNAKAFTTNLLFEIQDTGIGVAQEDHQRMFEPFQQHAPRSSGGTGLGLAITKRLVELMHGSISVKSTVNEGTLFRVLFPATSIVAGEGEVAEEQDVDIERIQFHGSTILLAEDNALNRAIIREYVASYDLHLVEAENGQEALQMLNPGSTGASPAFPSREGSGVGFSPDVILMDIHMPVMDGYTATREIRNSESEIRNIPIITLTAYALQEQKEKYQDVYDAYLRKPISKNELIATLAEFLPHTKENPPLTPDPSQEGNTRDILEDLKDYAAHTVPFPQAFLDKLDSELLPRHKEVSEVLSLDEMIEFAEIIISVGNTFAIPPLKHYGEVLLHYIKVFDFINMKRLLGQFLEIVEIINKIP